MIRSENARLSGWVYVDVRGRDLRSVVHDMQAIVARQVAMPAGYALSWSGQFEYLERATERLKVVVPLTLAVIFMLLYVLFRSGRCRIGHGGGSILAGRWVLVHLGARSRGVGGLCRGVHCPGRRCRRVWRRDAGLPAERLETASSLRRAGQ